jgi:hypothetical protein
MINFDNKSQRYRNKSTGKFMSRKQVVDLLENQISLIKKDLTTVTNLLLDNKITVGAWDEIAPKAIKRGNVIAYALGKGGKYQLNDKDYAKISNKIRFEFGYLRKFAESIGNGKLTSNQIRDRISKYGDGFYAMHEEGRRNGHSENKYKWERRYTSRGEICVDCSRYAAMGWQVIGSLPIVGQQSRCMSRCRCEFSFSVSSEKPTAGINEVRSFGWLVSKRCFGNSSRYWQ